MFSRIQLGQGYEIGIRRQVYDAAKFLVEYDVFLNNVQSGAVKLHVELDEFIDFDGVKYYELTPIILNLSAPDEIVDKMAAMIRNTKKKSIIAMERMNTVAGHLNPKLNYFFEITPGLHHRLHAKFMELLQRYSPVEAALQLQAVRFLIQCFKDYSIDVHLEDNGVIYILFRAPHLEALSDDDEEG